MLTGYTQSGSVKQRGEATSNSKRAWAKIIIWASWKHSGQGNSYGTYHQEEEPVWSEQVFL